VEIENVNYYYENYQALKDINLLIEKGNFIAIVGPNGSGKSTLVNIIAGLVKPQSGTVKIFGKEKLEIHDKIRISYVPQKVNSFNLSFPISVSEVMLLGFASKKAFGLSKNEKAYMNEIMQRFDIDSFAKRQLGRLSGGQQQRVFLAKALVSKPDLLLLDEPTVGIDAKSEDFLYKVLNEEKQRGTTIIMVTHDIFAVTEHADKVVCMDEGKIFTTCAAKEFSPAQFEKLYKFKVKTIKHKHYHSGK